MIRRQIATQPRLGNGGSEEPVGDVVVQQPVTVLRERRRIKGPVIDRETEEPLEQQVVVQSLTELSLGTDRVQRHQHRCFQQLLGWHRRPTAAGVHRFELVFELGEYEIDNLTDPTDRMPGRDQILRTQRRQHRQLPNLFATHTQSFPRAAIQREHPNQGISAPC